MCFTLRTPDLPVTTSRQLDSLIDHFSVTLSLLPLICLIRWNGWEWERGKEHQGRDWCLCSIRRTGRTWLESHSLQTPSCALCRWGDEAFTPLLTHKHFIQAAPLSCLFFSPEHFCLCPGPLLPRLTSLLSGSGPGSTVRSKCSKCLGSPGRALTPSHCLSLVAFYCAPLSTYL